MSFIRNSEKRTYFDGTSSSYVYTARGNEIRFQFGPAGSMDTDDFWEIVCRAICRVDGHEAAESFAERVEAHRRGNDWENYDPSQTGSESLTDDHE